MTHEHPANVRRHDDRTFGQRVADTVATTMGSWPYIIIQTLFLVVWIFINVTAFTHHWDPFPFILLNLGLSCQAAYAAPILQLSQNRQSDHDRVRAEHDYQVNQEALVVLRAVAEKLDIPLPNGVSLDLERCSDESD